MTTLPRLRPARPIGGDAGPRGQLLRASSTGKQPLTRSVPTPNETPPLTNTNQLPACTESASPPIEIRTISQDIVEIPGDLCHKILGRLENVLRNSPAGPSHYEFKGYSQKMVADSIRFMHDNDLIYARFLPEKVGENGLRCWPITLGEKGKALLATIEDRKGPTEPPKRHSLTAPRYPRRESR